MRSSAAALCSFANHSFSSATSAVRSCSGVRLCACTGEPAAHAHSIIAESINTEQLFISLPNLANLRVNVRVAHASRMLVCASRANNLFGLGAHAPRDRRLFPRTVVRFEPFDTASLVEDWPWRA